MTELEKHLLDSLLQLEETVRSRQPDLAVRLQRIDQLTTELPKTTDPDLLHYLHKKSYEKARLWLQGRNAENQAGHCPRVA